MGYRRRSPGNTYAAQPTSPVKVCPLAGFGVQKLVFALPAARFKSSMDQQKLQPSQKTASPVETASEETAAVAPLMTVPVQHRQQGTIDAHSDTATEQAPDPQTVFRNWAHTPCHIFPPGATYIVTCGIYQKQHLLNSPDKLTLILRSLFQHANEFGWQLEAWAVLINHYHFIAHAKAENQSLDRMLQALHSNSAIELNKLDLTPGRQAWWNYRDTCLTYPKSYFARLHYVHANPERHRVVARAENYPWCSMSWFLQGTNSGFRRTVLSFKIDNLKVPDDF
jgi:putative transposase